MSPIAPALHKSAVHPLHPAAQATGTKLAMGATSAKVAVLDADDVKAPVIAAPSLTPGRFLNKTA